MRCVRASDAPDSNRRHSHERLARDDFVKSKLPAKITKNVKIDVFASVCARVGTANAIFVRSNSTYELKWF